MATNTSGLTDAELMVRKYYQYVDQGNPEVVALFHRDAVYKRPGYDLMVGTEALEAFYGGGRLIAKGAHHLRQVYVMMASVAVEGTFTGILKSGLEVTLPFSDFFDLQHDGIKHLILSRRTYFDDQRI